MEDERPNRSPGGVGRFRLVRTQRPRSARPDRPTRERLLDAVERVLERGGLGAVTAGAVAAEADLAYGTFYRYFVDRRAAVLAAFDRLRSDLDALKPDFDAPVADTATERARIAAWVGAVLARPPAHRALLRSWFELLDTDAELRAASLARRQENRLRLRRYLERLAAAGLIAPPRSPDLAAALSLGFEAAFRSLAVRAEPDPPEPAAGILELFDRAIFGA